MPMDIILIVVLGLLVVFMFWNSRKRMAKMKAEQEAKARQTVPGAEVMLNGGIFGTIVSFNADDLDEPAEIEIAPGVVIKVHSQAIARIITPDDVVDEVDEFAAVPDDIETPVDFTPEDIIGKPAAVAEPADAVVASETDVPAKDAIDAVTEAADVDTTDGTHYDASAAPTFGTVDESQSRAEGDDTKA